MSYFFYRVQGRLSVDVEVETFITEASKLGRDKRGRLAGVDLKYNVYQIGDRFSISVTEFDVLAPHWVDKKEAMETLAFGVLMAAIDIKTKNPQWTVSVSVPAPKDTHPMADGPEAVDPDLFLVFRAIGFNADLGYTISSADIPGVALRQLEGAFD